MERGRITIKVGASTLTDPGHRIDDAFLERFVADIAAVREAGWKVILVSSGAIRTGVDSMGLRFDSLSVSEKQAAAAIGQGLLMAKYTEMFAPHGIPAAQVLLTQDIVQFRKKYLNARNTLLKLISMGAIPIVNENDTVATEEIMFGDNDTLSAITAVLTDSDLLLLLSDVDGFYMEDPGLAGGGRAVPLIEEITEELRRAATGPRAGGGFGGMATKLSAAETAMNAGIKTVIANGREKNIVRRVAGGERIGTTFMKRDSHITGRKKWIAFVPKSEGKIIVNSGAREVIKEKGKSLLPSGIVGVEGAFERGACVEIAGEDGRSFARGLTGYSSEEIARIEGKHTREIEKCLGYSHGDETVHRDNLVIL
ncbi:MAG: glutamate 5-kinase [bacterium]